MNAVRTQHGRSIEAGVHVHNCDVLTGVGALLHEARDRLVVSLDNVVGAVAKGDDLRDDQESIGRVGDGLVKEPQQVAGHLRSRVATLVVRADVQQDNVW